MEEGQGISNWVKVIDGDVPYYYCTEDVDDSCNDSSNETIYTLDIQEYENSPDVSRHDGADGLINDLRAQDEGQGGTLKVVKDRVSEKSSNESKAEQCVTNQPYDLTLNVKAERSPVGMHAAIVTSRSRCQNCGKLIQGDVRLHWRLCSGLKPCRCHVCGKQFTLSSNLKTHMRTHSGTKPYKCVYCSESFTYLHSLQRHVRVHNNGNFFECKDCNRKFVSRSLLESHLLSHTKAISGDGLPTKGVTNDAISSPSVTVQTRICTEPLMETLGCVEKSLDTSICSTSKEHQNQGHQLKLENTTLTGSIQSMGKEEAFGCGESDGVMDHNGNSSLHDRCRTSNGFYKCPKCQKLTSRKWEFYRHYQKHLGLRPFQCHFCLKTFTVRCNLNTHLRLHTGVKPYRCLLCSERFMYLHSLQRHIRVHNNGKFLECVKCNRKFTKASDLNSHLETHIQKTNDTVDASSKTSGLSQGDTLNRPINTDVVDDVDDSTLDTMHETANTSSDTCDLSCVEKNEQRMLTDSSTYQVLCRMEDNSNKTLSSEEKVLQADGHKPPSCLGNEIPLNPEKHHSEHASRVVPSDKVFELSKCGGNGQNTSAAEGDRAPSCSLNAQNPDTCRNLQNGNKASSSINVDKGTEKSFNSEDCQNSHEAFCSDKGSYSSKDLISERDGGVFTAIGNNPSELPQLPKLDQELKGNNSGPVAVYILDDEQNIQEEVKPVLGNANQSTDNDSTCNKVVSEKFEDTKAFLVKCHEQFTKYVKIENGCFVCQVCGKELWRKSEMQKHLRIHFGIRPFVCMYCSKSFTLNCNLKAHLRLHTGSLPYMCQECGQRFMYIHSLQRHARVHNNGKFFECVDCNRRFTGAKEHQEHMLSHQLSTNFPKRQPSELENKIQASESNTVLVTGPESMDRSLPSEVPEANIVKHGQVRSPIETPIRDKSTRDDEVFHKMGGENVQVSTDVEEQNGEITVSPGFLASSNRSPARSDVTFGHHTFNNIYLPESSVVEANSKVANYQPAAEVDKPYSCDVCFKRFTVKCNLKTHMRLHSGDKPYACYVCGERFMYLHSLQRHVRIHNSGKFLECKDCNRKFISIEELEQHRAMHTLGRVSNSAVASQSNEKDNIGDKPYFYGSEFGHSYKGLSRFQSEVQWNHVIKKEPVNEEMENYEANDTEVSKEYPKSTSSHIENSRALSYPTRLFPNYNFHSNGIAFPTYCLPEHENRMAVKNTNNVPVLPMGKFSMDYRTPCDGETDTNKALFQGQDVSSCSHPPQSLYRSKEDALYVRSLEEHENHAEEELNSQLQRKEFQCPYCDKYLYRKWDFDRHLRKHSGQRPFTCDYCGKCFGLNSSLKAHIRIHTNEQPYTCQECGLRFTYLHSLQRHVRIHNNGQFLECRACNRRFTAKMDYVVHMKCRHFVDAFVESNQPTLEQSPDSYVCQVST